MQPSAAPSADPTDPAVIALRASLIGDRVTIPQAAAALDVTTRCIYGAITRHHIPYVRIFGVRYISPAALRAALSPESADAPRRRGRPRKIAA